MTIEKDFFGRIKKIQISLEEIENCLNNELLYMTMMGWLKKHLQIDWKFKKQK